MIQYLNVHGIKVKVDCYIKGLIEELKSKESKDNITRIIDVKRTNGNSLDNIDFSTNKGFIIPDAPITINKLNILEPITLPIAIPF